jgi:hypothetical protein
LHRLALAEFVDHSMLERANAGAQVLHLGQAQFNQTPGHEHL